MSRPDRRLVIGAGNVWRRDDAAGIEVARRVAAVGAAGCDARILTGDGSRLLTLWAEHDDVYLVDAIVAPPAPGTVVWLDGTRPLPVPFGHSTHSFAVADALALARELGRLPARLTVVGVAGSDFRVGRGLSPPVESAVRGLAAALAGDGLRYLTVSGGGRASGSSA